MSASWSSSCCSSRPAPRPITSTFCPTAGVIDIIAIVPVPVALLAGVPADTAWLLASLWVLKLATLVPGLAMLGRVIALEARPLASVLVIFLIVLLLCRRRALHPRTRPGNRNSFGSLPLSLWWAVTTLTTTGYGDAVPQSLLGRLIAGLVMICGLGVFGMWTGILATGFAAEHRRRDFIRNWDLVTRVPFLSNLDPPAIIELTRMLRRVELAERTTVVRRGRPGDCMYFIASGEVEVKVEPQPIRLGRRIVLRRNRLAQGQPAHRHRRHHGSHRHLLVLEVADFRDLHGASSRAGTRDRGGGGKAQQTGRAADCARGKIARSRVGLRRWMRRPS